MKTTPRSHALAHVLLTSMMCVTAVQSATVTSLVHPAPVESADKNRDVLATLAVSAPSVIGDLLSGRGSHHLNVAGSYSETQWKFTLAGEYGGNPVDLMFAGMFDNTAAS